MGVAERVRWGGGCKRIGSPNLSLAFLAEPTLTGRAVQCSGPNQDGGGAEGVVLEVCEWGAPGRGRSVDVADTSTFTPDNPSPLTPDVDNPSPLTSVVAN